MGGYCLVIAWKKPEGIRFADGAISHMEEAQGSHSLFPPGSFAVPMGLVWRGYGTGMERVWSRLPPNPLQLRSSAEVDRGKKAAKTMDPEPEQAFLSFHSLSPDCFSALNLREGYGTGVPRLCRRYAWPLHCKCTGIQVPILRLRRRYGAGVVPVYSVLPPQ